MSANSLGRKLKLGEKIQFINTFVSNFSLLASGVQEIQTLYELLLLSRKKYTHTVYETETNNDSFFFYFLFYFLIFCTFHLEILNLDNFKSNPFGKYQSFSTRTDFLRGLDFCFVDIEIQKKEIEKNHH